MTYIPLYFFDIHSFPSSKKLNCTWWNVVKLGKSLYREGPGMDVNRPTQVSRGYVI